MIQKKSQGKRKVALSVENEGSRCFDAERTGRESLGVDPRYQITLVPAAGQGWRAGVCASQGGRLSCLLKGSFHAHSSTFDRIHARSRFEDSSAVSESSLSVTGRLWDCG